MHTAHCASMLRLSLAHAFSENSHLIKHVSYVYVAPTLHPLVAGKTRRSPAVLGFCGATAWREAVV